MSNFKDRIRLTHILESIGKLEKYLDYVSYEEFETTDQLRDACIRQLEVIGEAASHISHETTSKIDISWREIIGMRNILIHQYFGVDISIVWNTIKYEIPTVSEKISFFLDSRIE